MEHRKWIVVSTIVAIIVLAVGGAALATNPNAGCNQTPYENSSGDGANHSGAYDDTCDGSASANGNGDGNATGKPCAGCVGKADEKNPPGQAPDGSDSNAGYECDTNAGIGKTNPAHTGCEAAGITENPPGGNPGSEVLGAEVLGEKFLATTGTPLTGVAVTALLFILAGATIRVRTRQEERVERS